VARARLFIREARTTGDVGFYRLAETSLECAEAEGLTGPDLRALRAHVRLQFHAFAAVEAIYTPMPPDAGWLDHALLGDARMEQGKLDAAVDAYQRAVDLRPGLEMYDRIGWLRWLEGDLEGAMEMATLAVSAGSSQDPEPYAWVLTRLGWLRALQGQPSPELDQALALVPGYRPALVARGRVRLHAKDPAAAEDLRAAGRTVEAFEALAELDPTVVMADVREQDPRGYAMWLTPQDPVEAHRLLAEEWAARQDATTRMARAYALWFDGDAQGRAQAAEEARLALATGIVDPRVLRLGFEILGDRALAQRALAMGPGLLPSERARLEAALAASAN
jgi:tetratricopeptide (TPR) repeat protein